MASSLEKSFLEQGSNKKENKTFKELKNNFEKENKEWEKNIKHLLKGEKTKFKKGLDPILNGKIKGGSLLGISHKNEKIKYNITSYLKYTGDVKYGSGNKEKIKYTFGVFYKNNSIGVSSINSAIDNELYPLRSGLYPNSYNDKFGIFLNIKDSHKNNFNIKYEENKKHIGKTSIDWTRNDKIFKSTYDSIGIYTKFSLIHKNVKNSGVYLGKIFWDHRYDNISIKLGGSYENNFNNKSKNYHTFFVEDSMKMDEGDISIKGEYKKYNNGNDKYKVESKIDFTSYPNIKAVYEKINNNKTKVEFGVEKKLNKYTALSAYVGKEKNNNNSSYGGVGFNIIF